MDTQQYLTVDNLKNLVTIFERFMEERYAVSMQETSIDLRRVFFNTMQKLQNDAQYAGMTFRDLNTLTLRMVKPVVLQTLAPTSSTNAINNLTREQMVFGKRKNNSTHILPEVSSRQETTTDIMEHLDTYQKTREAEFAKTPASAKVTEAMAGEKVEAMNDTEFTKRLAMLEKQREAILLEQQQAVAAVGNAPIPVDSSTVVPVEAPVAETIKPVESPQALKEKESHDALKKQTPESYGMERNQDLAEAFSQQQPMDPKEFYKSSMAPPATTAVYEDFGAPSLKMSPQLGLVSSRQEFVPKVVPQTVLQEKYILINSVDRDWTTQQYRYRYKVKFNYTSQEVMKVPIYENNPTVPYTRTSTSSGIPNTSGWYDNNNQFYTAYNSSLPPGNIVGYEELTIAADVDANIQTNFKNIHSIEVTKVIIPLDILLENTQSVGVGNKIFFNNNFNLNFPYVLLQIDEFKDMYDGTDDVIRKSFCQLVFENSYQSGNGRGYVVLTPVQHEKKVFLPTALSALPSLNISLLRPNGELVNKSKDGSTILKIEYEPFNASYLKIVTNRYFDKNEFFKGDTILIRKYSLFKITGNQDASMIQAFNDFINRESGHDVTEIGEANENGYYRAFYIRAPGLFNDENGAYDIVQGQVNQLVEFNENFDVCNNPMNGFILNVSLQNSISIKIEQKVYDSIRFESENV